MDSERSRFDDLLQCVKQLPNGELTQQLRQLNEQKSVRDTELLVYLSELDARALYRQEAASSLFDFCVSRLGCSEDVAYKRVGAARLMRRFPLVFDLLCTGRIHLSALMLVKPHLTEENHREWLLAASGKSKRQVETLVARRCPKPDVATSVRKLPEPRTPHGSGLSSHRIPAPMPTTPMATTPAPMAPMATTTAPMVTTTTPMATTPAPMAPILNAVPAARIAPLLAAPPNADPALPIAPPFASAPHAVPAARIAPLSGSSYRVTFTASERWKQKLDRARELASHVISPSDLPGLLERAMDLLIEREERRRCAVGTKSRTRAEPRRDTESPAATGRQADAEGQADAESQADTKQQPCQIRHGGKATAQDPGRVVDFDAGNRPSTDQTKDPLPPAKPRSRHVPAAVRRDIWQRDEGRCTFTDAQGNRCEERCFLEIEHLQPFALNGSTSVSNCTLRCRCHNTLAAELCFGRRKIASAIARARKHRRPTEAKSLEIESGSEDPTLEQA